MAMPARLERPDSKTDSATTMSTISGEVHLEDRQEEFHERAADVEVVHRRHANDGGGMDGVFAVTWKTRYGSGNV